MTTKVQKWGNSLAIRIPSHTAKRLGLKAGSKVRTRETLNEIIIEPVVKRREETLEDLVAQIDPKNLPEKVDWGKPVGNEIW
jgi:antitoxin MazE